MGGITKVEEKRGIHFNEKERKLINYELYSKARGLLLVLLCSQYFRLCTLSSVPFGNDYGDYRRRLLKACPLMETLDV